MKLKSLIPLCTMLLATSSFAAAPDLSVWSSYADSIKNCTPGTFSLPDPIGTQGTPNMTFEIVGMKEGVCQVKIAKTMPMPNQQPPVRFVLTCNFSTSNAAILGDVAKRLASGTVQPNDDDATVKILVGSCK